MTTGLRTAEPESRRTHQPVRRNSRRVGSFETNFYRPVRRDQVGAMLTAAERFDLRRKRKGDRHGPLGAYGVRLLREFTRLIDRRTGRLDPALDTLMARLRISRDALVRAIAALVRYGFLEKVRRLEPTGDGGRRGPQVRQATNAYALLIPKGAEVAPPPPPEDAEHAREARLKVWRDAAASDETTPLGASLSRLARAMNASPPGGLNPAED